jgi:hypothetical protein
MVTRANCSIKYRKGKDRPSFTLRFRHYQNSFLSDCMTTTYEGTTTFRNVGNTHQTTHRYIPAHLSLHMGSVFAMAAPQQSCFRSTELSRDKETATLSGKGNRPVCLQMQPNTVAAVTHIPHTINVCVHKQHCLNGHSAFTLNTQYRCPCARNEGKRGRESIAPFILNLNACW